MIGGEDEIVQHLRPIFATIAPGLGTVPRTPGRTGDPDDAELGFLHCGPNGAGHFVKMVHNGIEYGMMASFAEGLNILHNANAGKAPAAQGDAETAPLEEPAVLPVRHRHHRGDRGLAAGERGRVMAAGPDRDRSVRIPSAR